MGQFIHTYPFFTVMITVITGYMVGIGTGWLWEHTELWRQSHFPLTSLRFVQWKWTVIQLYQKFTQRWYKK